MAIAYNGYGNEIQCIGCGEWVTAHALKRCRNCYERDTRPAPVTAKSDIDQQIELAEQRTLELLAKKKMMEQFGKDEDFDLDDAILFRRSFSGNCKQYTYVAVKTPVGWYITGNAAHIGMSFAVLVEAYLMHASEVWHCTEWTQVI